MYEMVTQHHEWRMKMSKKYVLELLNMDDDELNMELENVDVEDFRKALRLALKEQDRDTRHACAESIHSLDSRDLPWHTFAPYESERGEDVVIVSSAHSACMNCYKGVADVPNPIDSQIP
jgi:hypothetical protein